MVSGSSGTGSAAAWEVDTATRAVAVASPMRELMGFAVTNDRPSVIVVDAVGPEETECGAGRGGGGGGGGGDNIGMTCCEGREEATGRFERDCFDGELFARSIFEATEGFVIAPLTVFVEFTFPSAVSAWLDEVLESGFGETEPRFRSGFGGGDSSLISVMLLALTCPLVTRERLGLFGELIAHELGQKSQMRRNFWVET